MKKLINSISILFVFFFITISSSAQPIPIDSLYLGQKVPGRTPAIFNLSVAANFFTAERITISSDNKNIYYSELNGYSEMDGKPHTIKTNYYTFEKGKWNGPFTLFENLFSPSLSINGNIMYVQKGVTGAFYSVKNEKGWSNPTRFLSNQKITHYLQETNKGNFYISAYPANTLGGIDFSKMIISGSDTSVSSLGLPLNTAGHNFDYFIQRDEHYMIVSTSSGLAISYPKVDGTWTNPKNLGKEINFGLNSWGPYVTKDNKYLFYTTGTKPGYSDCRIYWVRISNKIDSLKTTNYEPYLKGQIKTQTAELNKAFTFTIPENTFIDDDENNTLTYSAILNNGNPLPVWLSFDSVKHTFSGTPSEVGLFKIKVSVTDTEKIMASCEFEIIVNK